MSLTGKTNEEKIWNFLLSNINNKFGAAGLMGNLYAESGLNPNNLQNSYESKLGYNDKTYTEAIDKGSYLNFAHDSAGYGLAQWTYWSRKQNLYNYAAKTKSSIGDLEMQLNFLMSELNNSYKSVLNTLKNAKSVTEASNAVLLGFEKPKDQSEANQKRRASFGQTYYDKYAAVQPNPEPSQPVSNTDQVPAIIKMTSTKHTTIKKNRAIKWIVLHYTAGVKSEKGHAEKVAQGFATSNRDASADFIVDDGEIVQYNPDPHNYYCWSVGGSKYTKVNTTLGAKYYGQCMNNNSISIEMCSRKKNTSTLSVSDDDWYLTDAVVNNAIILTKYLMKIYNIDINHVIMHHMVTGKICPQPWCKTEAALTNWYSFLNKVSDGGYNPEPIPTPTPGNSYSVKVTANVLNIRKGPGVLYNVVGTLKKDSYCTITEEQNGWGKLLNGSGWISLKYTVKEDPNAFVPYIAKVTANALNIRSGPGINYKVVGSIKKNESYTIIQEQDDWGLLKSRIGWVNLNYMKKV